ncbi:GNAT superfamily N-acetyltransferase [Microbacterium resistens]|uniref:GNAT superfamily N-acetyltransferase n=1 Tax=Microbacterium resistens TaxID=156977 RepID=A0ABU1SE56_9MICO|nr:GNAT family N-acetyltransferase [Microbacterium resistens]MDR6867844.1 GNAT superfamily N-acetyltransferase [Microbacterium resistens]
MTDLLAAYDAELRGERELTGALSATSVGPVWFGVFPGGTGFVGYRDLGDLDERGVRALVEDIAQRVAGDAGLHEAEWKTRAHDRAPGLLEALAEAGFAAEETESVMIGEASGLVQDVPLPPGVTIRRVFAEHDVLAMEEMQGSVFGDPNWRVRATRTLDALAAGADIELWVAEAGGTVICAGRLEPVAGTRFAGLWGGATRQEWRGRGIYRALTSRRARSALERGARYLQSDSTEFSRPILERAGLRKVTETTPYVWHRGDPA